MIGNCLRGLGMTGLILLLTWGGPLRAEVVWPQFAINADLWPTNLERNREHNSNFDAVIMEGTGHFLHMTAPDRFNRKLEQVITSMID